MPTPPRPASDETLAALAAGELDPAEASALRARAAEDPALAARIEAAARREARWAGEGLLPLPLPVLLGVMERVRAEPDPAWMRSAPHGRLTRLQVAARVAAAAVLVAVGIALSLGGVEPVEAAAQALRQVEPVGIGASVAETIDAGFALPPAPSDLALLDLPGPAASVDEARLDVPGGATTLLAASVLALGSGLWLARGVRRGPGAGLRSRGP